MTSVNSSLRYTQLLASDEEIKPANPGTVQHCLLYHPMWQMPFLEQL